MDNNKTELIKNESTSNICIKEDIDLSNPSYIINYGVSTQNQLLEFSDKALKTMSEQEYTDDIGNLTDELLNSIKMEKDEQKSSLLKWFSRKKEEDDDKNYNYLVNTSNKLDLIVAKFDQYQYKLIRDMNILQTLYEKNMEYYNNLVEYIKVGQEKISEIEEFELEKLTPGSMEYDNLENDLERFKSRLLDLELSKNVSFQLAPQIKLLQNSNEKLINKIQNTIVSTIPLWKTHMVIALSIENNLEVNKLLNGLDKSTINLSKDNYNYIENIKKSGKDPVIAVNEEFEDSIKEIKNIIN